MEDGDKLLFECSACKYRQEFDFAKYNKNGECITCKSCHKHYKITSGVLYGTELSIEEYKTYRFIQRLQQDEE